jgi:DNA-binding response OmpR family regulator
MTPELSLPLTVLVVGASDEVFAEVAEAFVKGDAYLVRLDDFLQNPKTPTEFIDLCIVDASSDQAAGVAVVRRARRRWPTVGICCVGCTEIVAALAAGADDVVPLDAPKPIIDAQIAAAFRRARVASAQLRVAYGDVVYDREARRVWVAGDEVTLTPRELRLFDILFLRAGSPVSLDTLQDYVWKDDGPPASNALAVYVSYLRRKLRGSRLAVVETMRGIGYRLARKADGADTRRPD